MASRSSPDAGTPRKRILIAEDDRDLLALYRLMLGGSYDIIEAGNGREAVELFKAHRPDLALMDIRESINELKYYRQKVFLPDS